MIIAQDAVIVLQALPLIFAFFTGLYCVFTDFDIKLLNIITIVLIVVGVSFIGIGVSACVTDDKCYYEVDCGTTYLYALGSGSGVGGTFILGNGGVHDVQYYIGYTNTKNNEYKQVKFDARISNLILDDSETPRAALNELRMSEKTIIPDLWVDYHVGYEYDIYIPTNGIKHVYAVN